MTAAGTQVDTAQAKTQAHTAITGYTKIEAGLAELRTKYANAVFDVRTAKGLADARAARGTLRDTRLLLEKTRAEEKADALAYGRLVDSEAKRIEAQIVALEEPIAQQVQTEDNRKEAERKAKADAEAARVAGIQRRIAWIRSRPLEAVGKIAAEIREAADAVASLPLTADLYAEFLPDALEARLIAHGKLVEMLRLAEASEAEAIRLKDAREAFETEQRVAAEQRQREDNERQDRIDREDAERARLRKIEDDRRAAQQKAEDDARAAAKAEQDRIDAAARAETQRREQAAAAERKRERETLEAAADPWCALTKLDSLQCAEGIALDDQGTHYELESRDIVCAVFRARDALAQLDKAAA